MTPTEFDVIDKIFRRVDNETEAVQNTLKETLRGLDETESGVVEAGDVERAVEDAEVPVDSLALEAALEASAVSVTDPRRDGVRPGEQPPRAVRGGGAARAGGGALRRGGAAHGRGARAGRHREQGRRRARRCPPRRARLERRRRRRRRRQGGSRSRGSSMGGSSVGGLGGGGDGGGLGGAGGPLKLPLQHSAPFVRLPGGGGVKRPARAAAAEPRRHVPPAVGAAAAERDCRDNGRRHGAIAAAGEGDGPLRGAQAHDRQPEQQPGIQAR